ncbi:MAG: universal stress protein [Gammaproteobacteria bacterium]|nr:universal stress protein [Gammaproteobacteria bacterium]
MPTKKAPAEAKFALHRIMVAMDSSVHAQAAAEAAVGLAVRFEAVVEGLFVEDVNLINLAEHPVGRLVSFPSGMAGTLDRGALERYIRNECRSAQRALETVANRRGLRAGFRILRGRVDSEIFAAASEADLLVLGLAGRSGSSRGRPGSVALAAAERAPGSVLIYRTGVSPSGNPLLCFDGLHGSVKALDAAISLPRENNHEIRVALIPSEAFTVTALRERVEELLSDRGLNASFVECAPQNLDQLCKFAASAGTNAIVLAAKSPVLQGEGLRRILADANCPLLLVR